MWQPDPDAKDLRASLEALSQSISTVHEQLERAPNAARNRADAIRVLRNVDYALGGLALAPDSRSVVQNTANLADDWNSTFDAATALLKNQIAVLMTKVAELEPLETMRARLEQEEQHLQHRRRELERLQKRAGTLQTIVEEREALERQTEELQNDQAPKLDRIETAMTSMGSLLNNVAAEIETRNAAELVSLVKELSSWMDAQRASETEQSDLRSQIEALRLDNLQRRADIDKEKETLNSVTEENVALVRDLHTHLTINMELNDALKRYGVDDGVQGLDDTIKRLGTQLADLDSGLQHVLKHRQEALSRGQHS